MSPWLMQGQQQRAGDHCGALGRHSWVSSSSEDLLSPVSRTTETPEEKAAFAPHFLEAVGVLSSFPPDLPSGREVTYCPRHRRALVPTARCSGHRASRPGCSRERGSA